MTTGRLIGLTALMMAAFAANSVLCRLALGTTGIDPATFTAVRLASGAASLWAITRARPRRDTAGGNWPSAAALFVYAAAFSFAYVSLTTGTGALILFGAVQLTMFGYGLARGEQLRPLGVAGALMAIAGLVILVAPGLAAPAPGGAALMATAGAAWGVYSIRGRGSIDPTQDNAGNFLRACLLGAGLAVAFVPALTADPLGVTYALMSGAIASGVGYALWYTVLPHMATTSAGLVQLSVPVLAAAAGVLLLGEALTWRLVAAAAAIVGGNALAFRR
jgi:drug/metabolite transporter (DMT)-like permease